MAGHEFRQAQTALSIQAIDREGYRLDYATPVLGKPWSIPMEFPLYQWLAAGWRDLTGQDVVAAGRWVSITAFFLSLPAVLLILRSIGGISWGAGFLMLALIVSTPVYAFYSAAVLIESLAWAASCWFLWGMLAYRTQWRGGFLTVALIAGAVAVLVKPTTWAVACLPWAVFWMKDAWSALRQRSSRDSWLLQTAVCGIVLLALGYGWVLYADHLKSQNPIAHFLLSEELTEFNFGSWASKVLVSTWATLAGHWQRDIMMWVPMVLGLGWSLVQRRSRTLAALGLFAFVGIQLIFTNLYVAHDYYLFANAAYLVVAIAAGLGAWWDAATGWGKSTLPAGLAFIVLIFLNVSLFQKGLHREIVEQTADEPKLAALIRDLTEPDDVIVAHTGDWNSALAFHSNRRMLMIPDSQMFFHPEKVNQNIALLSDESVPLMIVGGEAARQPGWIVERIL